MYAPKSEATIKVRRAIMRVLMWQGECFATLDEPTHTKKEDAGERIAQSLGERACLTPMDTLDGARDDDEDIR